LNELISDNGFVRAQDFFDVLINIGINPNGRHEVWAFVREYWVSIIYKLVLIFDIYKINI
jgi:hypothetical protein